MSPEISGSDPPFLAAFGAVISDLRTEKRLDRKELAEAAGISYSYLSAIESGQKLPSTSVREMLAEALDVTPHTLLAMANDVMTSSGEPTGSFARPAPGVVAARADTVSSSYASAPLSDPEAWISPSGALAELGALLRHLSPEDTAMVVAMARRLAEAPPNRRSHQRERAHRGPRGRESRTEAYLRFWTMYLDALDVRGLDWARGRSPEPRSYFTTPSPIRGTSLSASFARNRLLRHELYINRGSRTANIELLRELEARRDELEAAYGGTLEIEDPGRERRAVRIAEYRDGHISRTEEFDDYVEWFIDRGTRMRRALEVYEAG